MKERPFLGGIFVTIILLLYVILCEREFLISTGSYVYIFQTIFFTLIILNRKDNRYYFFSPSYIALLYLNLNFIIGHYTVSRGVGLHLTYYNAFNSYASIQFIIVFFLLCNLIVFASIPFKKIQRLSWQKISKIRKINFFELALLFGFILIFGFIKIDLSLIGGGGDFTYVYKLISAIFIVLALAKSNLKWRYFLYIFLILFFLIGHYNSKREVVYVVILIAFLEIIYKRIDIKVTFKQLCIGLLGVVTFIYIVTISSIMRGYGNYEVQNFGEAVSYVSDYVTSDLFMDSFTANFETNSVYGNSTNAINYIYSDQANLTFGTTFLKFIFLPIPRSIFPDKPESMIGIYTTKFAPAFKAIGGSYPIIIYSEVFWNFHLLGLVPLFFIFLWFNYLYIYMIKKLQLEQIGLKEIFLLFMFVTLLQFIRGSGFEIWLVYGILSLPLGFLILKIKNRVSK